MAREDGGEVRELRGGWWIVGGGSSGSDSSGGGGGGSSSGSEGRGSTSGRSKSRYSGELDHVRNATRVWISIDKARQLQKLEGHKGDWTRADDTCVNPVGTHIHPIAGERSL
uniref:Uncharacterized protein n=1 Tax=Vespula pensylvanica TaxID=30213 RepID=A0A834NC41_VESPE|nr:hypothetical protein H0235_015339 [Vespula pensylvanica]